MSDYENQRSTIETLFAGYFKLCPVAYDNVDVLSDGEKASGQNFVRVSLRGLYRKRMGFGNQFVFGGTIMVQVYAAAKSGTHDVNIYCDALDQLFTTEIQGYQFGNPVRGGSALTDEGRYLQSIYTIDYHSY